MEWGKSWGDHSPFREPLPPHVSALLSEQMRRLDAENERNHYRLLAWRSLAVLFGVLAAWGWFL